VSIRLVIAEDHPLSREGLRQYLEMAGDIEVVGEASNGQELLELLERPEVAPDVALVDARMPVMDGISAARAIAERFPGVAVIILSAFEDTQQVDNALGAGVHGYVLKDRGGEELIRALRRVLAGETVIDTERQSAAGR